MSDRPTGFPSRPFSYGVFTPEIIAAMAAAPNAGAAKQIEKDFLRRIDAKKKPRR